MKKESSLRKESLDALLRVLDSDPNRAGEQYVQLRRRLILYFASFSASDPEDLSDETLDRVAVRVGDQTFRSEPAFRSYVLGFARNVRLEYFKKLAKNPILDEAYLPEIGVAAAELDAVVDGRLECLSKCLDDLQTPDRELILVYYRYEKSECIQFRKNLARRIGISVDALHTRVSRIRLKIRGCILRCLKKNV